MKAGADHIGVTVSFHCNDGKGNFILHKRSKACRDERGRWDSGGGRLEFGEQPRDAVLREIMEEYGLKGEIQEQMPAFSLIRKQYGKTTHWLVIPFFVKVDVKKARIMEPEKAAEIGVFTLDKLPKPLHTGLKAELSLYKRYFEKYGKN
jgi:ADP-ribose pyrophosphatase YjhB (NUDIX family)